MHGSHGCIFLGTAAIFSAAAVASSAEVRDDLRGAQRGDPAPVLFNLVVSFQLKIVPVPQVFAVYARFLGLRVLR